MGFVACHPAINFIYFTCVITSAVMIEHPIYLAISLITAFAYSAKLNRAKGMIFGFILLLCAAAFALWYSAYNHFGVTVLRQNFVHNRITLEALVYGLVIGLMIACALLWLSCVHAIFITDKVVYLFGRVSPHLALYLAILLRMIPRMKQYVKKLNIARTGIGMGVHQGNIFKRFRNALQILSMLITWSIEMLTNVSESMRSRGSGLRGRTAFSIYRFDNRDRAYTVAMFTLIIVLGIGILLKQSYSRYAPAIYFAAVTPLSCAFYLCYAALCLMPLALDVWTEYRFRNARQKYII